MLEYLTVFNPTIEVVTSRLREWCMLGVLFLPAFSPLGHEIQNRVSTYDGMHECTDLGLYSRPKEFLRNAAKTHVNSMGKNALYRRLRGRSNSRRCITQDSKPQTLPAELFWPPEARTNAAARPRCGEDL